MTKSTVDFYYDFGSPAAYLAWTQLPAICQTQDVQLHYRPVLLGGVFKATGNATPMVVEAKGAWLLQDLARHATRYGVPFRKNPYFIINTLKVMRGAIWAQENGCLEVYNQAMFEATWVDGKNTDDLAVIDEILSQAGLDSSAFRAGIESPETKQRLIYETDQAVQRGVFGVPTMFVGKDLFFGQDRLEWVSEALQSSSEDAHHTAG